MFVETTKPFIINLVELCSKTVKSLYEPTIMDRRLQNRNLKEKIFRLAESAITLNRMIYVPSKARQLGIRTRVV